MSVFQKISTHEQVVFCNHEESGLRAIVAIHDTTLGPALGGCRMWPYKTEEEALQDVLRLAEGMTYKCAAADVDFGGGKAVIIGDPKIDKSPELFRAFGRFVESLNGRFYTGTDMVQPLKTSSMHPGNLIVLSGCLKNTGEAVILPSRRHLVSSRGSGRPLSIYG